MDGAAFMTIPTPPSNNRRDYYNFPPLGKTVRVKGLVSTTTDSAVQSLVKTMEEFPMLTFKNDL